MVIFSLPDRPSPNAADCPKVRQSKRWSRSLRLRSALLFYQIQRTWSRKVRFFPRGLRKREPTPTNLVPKLLHLPDHSRGRETIWLCCPQRGAVHSAGNRSISPKEPARHPHSVSACLAIPFRQQ